MKKRIITILMALMLFASTAWAGGVCLEWDPNTEPDVAGYKVFARAEVEPSYDYNNPAWQGPETTCSFVLEDGVTYYFVARAYDTEGLESGDSNEVSWFNDFPWVNTPPATVNLRIVDCATLP